MSRRKIIYDNCLYKLKLQLLKAYLTSHKTAYKEKRVTTFEVVTP